MPAAKYVMKLLAADKISRVLKRVQGNISKFNKKSRFNFQRLKGPILAAGTAAAAFAALSINSFRKFEQGVVNVRKTTGLGFEEISDTIQGLAKRLPISTDNLLEIAGAAGQLGVKGAGNIAKFTETFAKLEVASNVAGEEGAKQIARILTVTGDGIPTIDRFSAALVDLGNNSAASESEILEMSTRVAGATARFDVGSAGVLGISAALKSLGRRSEESGGVIGRAFNSIDQAIRNGGFEMEQLQVIMGKTGSQIKKQFKDDAAGTFKSFIDGLSRMDKKGFNVTKTLKNMGLSGVRIDAVIGTLVKNNDVLEQSLTRSNKAYKENSALNKEFGEQTKTTNAKIQKFKNALGALFITIGQKLAPAFKVLLDVSTKFLNTLDAVFQGKKDLTKALSPVRLAQGALGSIVNLGKSLGENVVNALGGPEVNNPQPNQANKNTKNEDSNLGATVKIVLEKGLSALNIGQNKRVKVVGDGE